MQLRRLKFDSFVDNFFGTKIVGIFELSSDRLWNDPQQPLGWLISKIKDIPKE
jgi:hypothetical protein